MKCPKCQSEDIFVLSAGEILCLNEKCFAVSVPEKVVQNQSQEKIAKSADGVGELPTLDTCKGSEETWGH